MSRRRVASGAAWLAPVLVVATASPAFAASCVPHRIQPFPNTNPGTTSGNGWSITTSGGVAVGSTRFFTGSLVSDTDPAQGQTHTATASSGATLVGGRTYRLRYTWTAVTSNTLSMTCRFLTGSTLVPGSIVDTTTSGTSGTVSVDFVMPTPSPTSVSFQMSVTSPAGGTTTGDDITVTGLTLTCL